jgi:glycine/D-amino acid oxidase-like deaminating enzyme
MRRARHNRIGGTRVRPQMLDLRTGTPVWMAYSAPDVPCVPLRHDVRTDVLVVGMGISGAMVAESLTAAGFRVIVIDRRGPLLGSTPASTALVQYEIDVPLTRLSHSIGRENAERAWRRSRLAVANLGARIDELGIRCDKADRTALLLAGDDLDAEGLRAEAKARRAAGLYAEYLTRVRLEDRFGIRRDGAILSPGTFVINPRRLTAELLRCAIARKAQCFAPNEAMRVESTGSAVAVTTSEGPVITAAHVVLATGYELSELVPATAHKVVSTWVIATRQQPRAIWPEDVLIWESSDPYLYVRSTTDGRVVCGGEDEPFTDTEKRDSLIPAKAGAIAAKLERLFPSIDARPEFSWAGAFGTTETGLPLIGRVPKHPRVHAIAGYGGNGITFARMAAELVRSELTGGLDADSGLFAF